MIIARCSYCCCCCWCRFCRRYQMSMCIIFSNVTESVFFVFSIQSYIFLLFPRLVSIPIAHAHCNNHNHSVPVCVFIRFNLGLFLFLCMNNFAQWVDASENFTINRSKAAVFLISLLIIGEFLVAHDPMLNPWNVRSLCCLHSISMAFHIFCTQNYLLTLYFDVE